MTDTWDIEMDYTSSESMTAASDTFYEAADTTGADAYADAGWYADTSSSFAADGESWDSWASSNVETGAMHIENANYAMESGDIAGYEWEMNQASSSFELADDGWSAADNAYDTAIDYGSTSYDIAADTSYDMSYDTSYDSGFDTSYDSGLDTSYDSDF